VTGDDLYAWAEHRTGNEGVSAASVNRVDLVAVSSVFGWAAKRQGGRLIEKNPRSPDVRLDVPKAAPKREATLAR
jgi:hypothetical protein